jgi:hypothetical protein
MVGRVLTVLVALAVLYGCGQANSAAEDRTIGVGSGSAAGRSPGDGGYAGAEPNAIPVPDVVGLPVLAACRVLRPSGYRGAVVGEVADGVSGPSRVVAQEPKAGRKGHEGQLVRLTVSEPYPAGVLEQNPECLDRTQFGPGGKPNEPT